MLEPLTKLERALFARSIQGWLEQEFREREKDDEEGEHGAEPDPEVG